MAEAHTVETQGFLISTFYLGQALCGLDTLKVQEVVRLGRVTPVHDSPEYLVGIINLRGKIITVIDLGLKLGLGPREACADSLVYIIESWGEYIGLLIDGVADVVAVEREGLAPPPENVNGVLAQFITGVWRTDLSLIAILDVETVLEGDSAGSDREA